MIVERFGIPNDSVISANDLGWTRISNKGFPLSTTNRVYILHLHSGPVSPSTPRRAVRRRPKKLWYGNFKSFFVKLFIRQSERDV